MGTGAVLKAAILAVALGVAACSGGSELTTAPTATPSASSSSPSASPSAAWAYCAEAGDVGRLVRQVRKGIELPDVLIASATELIDQLSAFAVTVDLDDREPLVELVVAVSLLRLAILDAGAGYPFDPIVKIRAQTLSVVGLTASLALDC